MTDIPSTEPASFTQGEYVQWTRTLDDYPATSWTLSYSLVKSSVQITFNATASGTDHLVTLTTSTTADYTAGIYKWQAHVDNGSGERYLVDEGSMEILLDFAQQTSGYDDRSHVKQVLDALEATILKRATKDQGATVIAGEILSKMPIHRVLEFYDKYKALYAQEQAAENIANGLGHSGNVLVRFSDA